MPSAIEVRILTSSAIQTYRYHRSMALTCSLSSRGAPCPAGSVSYETFSFASRSRSPSSSRHAALSVPGTCSQVYSFSSTLGRLFDFYGEEVPPTKSERTRRRSGSATGTGSSGSDVRAGSTPRASQWATGRFEWDLTFLVAVLNWAERSRDEQGRLLLDRNTLKGLRKPRKRTPPVSFSRSRSTKRF